jgi:phosphatidylglycerol lysyltransferase
MTAERVSNDDFHPDDTAQIVVGMRPPLHIVGEAIEPSVTERLQLSAKLKSLRRFGTSTHSFLTLYSGVKYFQVPGINGYIPITESKGFILIIGEPVCDQHSGKFLVEALKNYADENDASLGAVPVGEAAKDFLADCGFRTVYVGKEPIFDLTNLTKLSRTIRQAVNRAKRKGFKVIRFDAVGAVDPVNDEESKHHRYQAQITELCDKWIAQRELPPMGFLFELRPLELKEHKKYFLLVDEQDRVRSFLACSPIYAKNGWYLEDLVRDGTAPNGCTELLVTETLEALAADGYKMATLGLAPLAGLPEHDEERPTLNKIMRFCYKHLSFIYHFQALEHFKTKFHPQSWENNYFCHYSTCPRIILIGNLLGSFVPYNLGDVLKHKLTNCKWRWR